MTAGVYVYGNHFRYVVLCLGFLCLTSICSNYVIINFTFICMAKDDSESVEVGNGVSFLNVGLDRWRSFEM